VVDNGRWGDDQVGRARGRVNPTGWLALESTDLNLELHRRHNYVMEQAQEPGVAINLFFRV
jgi:hypothetical protein